MLREMVPIKRRAFDPTGYTLTQIKEPKPQQEEEIPEYELIGVAMDTSNNEMLYVVRDRVGIKYTATLEESTNP